MRAGRKSLAVDPALLQSSSEGEGNQGDDDIDESGQGETNRASKGLNSVTRKYGLPQASADSPGTRRPLCLSGDGVESGGSLLAKPKAATPAVQKNKPDKRRLPPCPITNTHNTPQGTDADADDVDLAVPANSKKSKNNKTESILKFLSVAGNGTRQKTLLPLKYVSSHKSGHSVQAREQKALIPCSILRKSLPCDRTSQRTLPLLPRPTLRTTLRSPAWTRRQRQPSTRELLRACFTCIKHIFASCFHSADIASPKGKDKARNRSEAKISSNRYRTASPFRKGCFRHEMQAESGDVDGNVDKNERTKSSTERPKGSKAKKGRVAEVSKDSLDVSAAASLQMGAKAKVRFVDRNNQKMAHH